MTTFCSNCKHMLLEAHIYCSQCGTKKRIVQNEIAMIQPKHAKHKQSLIQCSTVCQYTHYESDEFFS